MSDDAAKHGRRFVLRGWHLALAVFLVVVALIVLYFVSRRNSIERRLEALRAAGYPTSLAELEEYTKLPEGAQNAVALYAQAFAAFVPPVDEANMPLLGQAKLPDRGAPLPEPMAKAVATCLARNQTSLAMLHEAAGFEHCRYGWSYMQGIPQGQTQAMRSCGRLLGLEAAFHAQHGDANAAAVCLRDGLRLSDSVQKDPTLIAYLVRVALVGVALSGLERSVSLSAFTDQQLQEMDATLARTGGTLDFTGALVAERCFMIEVCRNPSLLGPSGSTRALRLFPFVRGTCLSDILDSMADRIEASRLPPTERLRRFRQADTQVQQLSLLHFMTRMMTPALSRVAELDLRTRAHLDLARTAVAVERYRLTTGKVPDQLQELVPQYLELVPVDPFDEQPIRYQRTARGYILYSVDRDAQDNGGREQDQVNKDKPYDLCFIVTR
jgi:hypothetical protein